jgi:hypothetical protein
VCHISLFGTLCLVTEVEKRQLFFQIWLTIKNISYADSFSTKHNLVLTRQFTYTMYTFLDTPLPNIRNKIIISPLSLLEEHVLYLSVRSTVWEKQGGTSRLTFGCYTHASTMCRYRKMCTVISGTTFCCLCWLVTCFFLHSEHKSRGAGCVKKIAFLHQKGQIE